jgi:hypothetical protein
MPWLVIGATEAKDAIILHEVLLQLNIPGGDAYSRKYRDALT